VVYVGEVKWCQALRLHLKFKNSKNRSIMMLGSVMINDGNAAKVKLWKVDQFGCSENNCSVQCGGLRWNTERRDRNWNEGNHWKSIVKPVSNIWKKILLFQKDSVWNII
jgi:hypothetical protein